MFGVVVMVMIDDGLLGGIDPTVPQDMDCAQGQRVGMVFCSAARLAGSDSENDAKPGGGNWLKVA